MTDADLRHHTLERQINALIALIRGAQSSLLVYNGMVIVFVVFIAMYNPTFSWHRLQIDRRARLVSAVYNDKKTMDSLIDKDPFLKTVLKDTVGELGYLSYFYPESDNDTIKLNILRENASLQLTEYIHRGFQIDTITLPFLGISIETSYIGLIGGMAVAFVGFWLFAVIRRENIALQEFIKLDPEIHDFVLTSDYNYEESRYVYKSIVNHMIFIHKRKQSLLVYITILIFALPPLLFLVYHAISIHDIFKKGLGVYIQSIVLQELASLILICFSWLGAMSYRINTLKAMRAWSVLLESKSVDREK